MSTRNLIHTGIFLSATILILTIMENVYDKFVIEDHSVSEFKILNHKNDSFDFAVLGSSTAQCNVDVITLQDELSQTGINLGIGGAGLAEQYLNLNLFLRTNTIGHLLLSVDIFGLDSLHFKHPFNEFYYLPFLDTDADIYSFLVDYCGNKTYAWRYLPFFKYAEFNNEIGIKNFLNIYFNYQRLDETGTFLLDGALNDEQLNFDYSRNFMHKSQMNYLVNILDTLKKHNIKTTLFSSPQFSGVYKYQLDKQKVFDYYKQMAKNFGIAYLEFEDLSFNQHKENYKDPIHYNKTGARLFAKMLGKSLLNRDKER